MSMRILVSLACLLFAMPAEAETDREALEQIRAKGLEVTELADRLAFEKAVEQVYTALDPAVAAIAKRVREAK
jgi:TRAP-type C4-dicarboxylate transport system substrate-binding protein